jgi:hypothetical protein
MQTIRIAFKADLVNTLVKLATFNKHHTEISNFQQASYWDQQLSTSIILWDRHVRCSIKSYLNTIKFHVNENFIDPHNWKFFLLSSSKFRKVAIVIGSYWSWRSLQILLLTSSMSLMRCKKSWGTYAWEGSYGVGPATPPRRFSLCCPSLVTHNTTIIV